MKCKMTLSGYARHLLRSVALSLHHALPDMQGSTLSQMFPHAKHCLHWPHLPQNSIFTHAHKQHCFCNQVIASQRQLEAKYNQAKDTSDQWYRRAQLALEKGDEGLAREALSRRKGYDVSLRISV